MVKQIPNWLTLFRIGLVPLLVVLLIDPSPGMVRMAFAVFIVAVATDFIDGALARRLNAITDFGKLLDPLADKLLVMAALVMLATQRTQEYGDAWVPGWLVVVVLAREFWVTGLRAVAASRGIVVAAKQAGKFKSGFQMVAIAFLFLHDYAFRVFGQSVSCQLIGLNLLLVSVAFSYWGAAEYTVEIFGLSKASSASDEA
jgi:CDP-diacylglycerol--glycerol-3-phosphate 3-phosphatidyltransferase